MYCLIVQLEPTWCYGERQQPVPTMRGRRHQKLGLLSIIIIIIIIIIVVGPFLARLANTVGLSFLGPRFISLSCFSRCKSLPGLLRQVADKCAYCSQRSEFYLCVCASNVCLNCLNTWPAEAISSRAWAGYLKCAGQSLYVWKTSE